MYPSDKAKGFVVSLIKSIFTALLLTIVLYLLLFIAIALGVIPFIGPFFFMGIILLIFFIIGYLTIYPVLKKYQDPRNLYSFWTLLLFHIVPAKEFVALFENKFAETRKLSY
jgi:hypothetical protein